MRWGILLGGAADPAPGGGSIFDREAAEVATISRESLG